MQFKIALIAAVLAAPAAMAASITAFAGAGCTGAKTGPFSVSINECATFGGSSFKSIHYDGIPNSIQFYESGGGHDSCTHGSSLTRQGTGCATAPTGFNWESVLVK